LLAALDDWSFARAKLGAGTEESLLDFARLADDDPWRQRLRDPKVRGNRTALECLAKEKSVLDQPPADLALLSHFLFAVKAKATAIELLRQAQQRYPGDFWICAHLAANLIDDAGTVTEAWGYARVAVALRPHDVTLRNNFAICLYKLGKSVQAEQEFRTTIQLNPKLPEAHYNLGVLLQEKGRVAQAEEEYRTTISLKPQYAPVHLNLGICLQDQGKLAQAEKEFRAAIKLPPQLAEPHYALGVLLRNQGKPADAEKEFRKAIRLHPKHDLAHLNLGKLLAINGNLENAEIEFHAAIAANSSLADAHYNLGLTLTAKPGQDIDGAIACYQSAIALAPNHAEAHCNLGELLRRQGRFADALKHLMKGHDLGSRKPDAWHYPSDRWVQRCESLLALDEKLASIQAGQTQPAGPGEQLGLAMLCRHFKREYLAAAQFYAAAFSAAPVLAEDMTKPVRYDAACAAVLAAAGAGMDANGLDAEEKAKWRKQALTWLTADLTHWQHQAAGASAGRQAVIKVLSNWQTDPTLASVRSESNLAKLPQEERQAWQTLWADVAAAIEKTKK
jgi:Flp pilus assembly protein TadD